MKLHFDETYLHQYEDTCVNAVSGIHIDGSSEYSNNSIKKKNGVIHSLGDFDGLPQYFKYTMREDLYRAHVELYTIRDAVNNYNQKTIEKQTAAMIVDSAIPVLNMGKVTSSLNLVIKYDLSREEFVTDGESITPGNTLSELTYHNDYEFGTLSRAGYESHYSKFVYHGNNLFSLTISKLDPVSEYGRAFLITNDDSIYDNNTTSENNKPPRTVARICDIPTSYLGLISIPNNAPSIIIDEKYVRMGTCMSVIDKDNIWNNKVCKFIKPTSGYIFGNDYDINSIDMSGYKKQTDFDCTFDLSSTMTPDEYTLTPSSGTGYSVGDTFKFNIGGLFFEGTVTGITGDDNEPSTITVSNNTSADKIPIPNIGSSVSSYSTDTIEGEGSGMKVVLTISLSAWESLQQKESDEYIDDLFVFKYDDMENIWLWYYDGESFKQTNSIQLTGEKIKYNPFDVYNEIQRIKRKVSYAKLFNDMNSFKISKNSIDKYISSINETDYLITHVDLDSDNSNLIIDYDNQDSLYTLMLPTTGTKLDVWSSKRNSKHNATVVFLNDQEHRR